MRSHRRATALWLAGVAVVAVAAGIPAVACQSSATPETETPANVTRAPSTPGGLMDSPADTAAADDGAGVRQTWSPPNAEGQATAATTPTAARPTTRERQTDRDRAEPPTEPAPSDSPTRPSVSNTIVDAARRLAAAHFGLGRERSGPVRLVRWESVYWSDASLGCTREGMAYATAEVSGFIMTFEHQGRSVNVHMSEDPIYGTVPTACIETRGAKHRPRPNTSLEGAPATSATPAETGGRRPTPTADWSK